MDTVVRYCESANGVIEKKELLAYKKSLTKNMYGAHHLKIAKIVTMVTIFDKNVDQKYLFFHTCESLSKAQHSSGLKSSINVDLACSLADDSICAHFVRQVEGYRELHMPMR